MKTYAQQYEEANHNTRMKMIQYKMDNWRSKKKALDILQQIQKK